MKERVESGVLVDGFDGEGQAAGCWLVRCLDKWAAFPLGLERVLEQAPRKVSSERCDDLACRALEAGDVLGEAAVTPQLLIRTRLG